MPPGTPRTRACSSLPRRPQQVWSPELMLVWEGAGEASDAQFCAQRRKSHVRRKSLAAPPNPARYFILLCFQYSLTSIGTHT
jgi:hypothetical protein